MIKRYFTADLHFSKTSTNVLNRPFSSSLEMSEYILDKINTRVKRKDELLILGDFAFTTEETKYWRTKIKCKNIKLCLGNHDPKNIDELRKIFGYYSVRSIWESKCVDVFTWCSHYPHFYWPKSHYNSFSLYGHCHDMRSNTIETIFPNIRSMDCGLDTAKRILGEYEPFHEQEIYDILSVRTGHDPVDFYIQQRGTYKKDHKKD